MPWFVKKQVSFKTVQMNAEEKKHYNIDETLIKLYILKAGWFCVGKKMAKILLLDSTIKISIDELTKTSFQKITSLTLVFLVQCNETTDIA